MGQQACKPLPKTFRLFTRRSYTPRTNGPLTFQSADAGSRPDFHYATTPIKCFKSRDATVDLKIGKLKQLFSLPGPAMLEVRHAPSITEPREFTRASANKKDAPSMGVLFGGAASVAAALAAGGHSFGLF